MTTTCEDKFVTLIASLEGCETVRRRVRKDVIQSESSFLKEYIEDGISEIQIPLKRPMNLNLIFEYLNEGQLTVPNGNHLESLWNDARILGLVNLETDCIQRLTDTISLDSWTWRLEFAQAEGCYELESSVLSFLNANSEKCCRSARLTSLRVDQMAQVLQLPTVKTAVPESKRIALILDWIKANEVDRCRQAHRLLQEVDLMELNESSLRSFFDDEPALRNWRSVAIFQRAIRLKRTENAARHSEAIQGQLGLVQGRPGIVHGQLGTIQGQSEAVQCQLDTVQGQLDTVQGQLSTVQGQSGTVQGQSGTVQGQSGTVQGQPSTVQDQLSKVQGQSGAVQGQLSTVQDQLSKVQGQSGAVQGQLSTVQSQPSTVQDQPSTVQDQLSTVQGQSGAVQGQLSTVQGQPSTVQGQPRTVQGQPSTVQGQPSTVQDQPSTVQGQSGIVQGQPSTVQGQPGTVADQSDTVQGLPGTGQSDTVGGQPRKIELIQANPIVFESLENRLCSNAKQEVASEESSPDVKVNESNGTTDPDDSARECRILMKQQVRPPLPSSVCETTETVHNNDDEMPPPKMPRLECSSKEIQPFIQNEPKRTNFLVSKQKQILYFSQLGSGATSLNFVLVSAAGAISAPQQLLAGLPSYGYEVPKLIWNQQAGHLCFLGDFTGNREKVPTFSYMNSQGSPEVTVLPTMINERHNHQPVLLNGRLYAIGGSQSVFYKNNDRLSSAEVLDMKTATWQWRRSTSMSVKRDLYAAACVEGNIYVIGGAIDRPTKDEALITKHTLRYQPRENRWKYLSIMNNSRCCHTLAVLGHKIYAFGGSRNNYNLSQDVVTMKSAEVYDVHTNTWTLIAPMLRPRYGACAIEIEGKIYVIGGDKIREGESRSSVECYDPVSNSWSLVCESIDDRGVFNSVAVIHDPEYFLKGN